MPIDPRPPETGELIHSLKKYFTTELEQEIGDLRAQLLLDFIFKEIAPIAYNQGVRDAEIFFRGKIEDLPATCFEPALTYWRAKKR
ncbi:MAG TPA: DUF2164 domain-containing protein [Lacunisphaera sp.]|jgi:uncharacterized protein (DUF2164 family)